MPKKDTVPTPWKNPPASVEGLAGFVYLITCNITGKMYVGRKYFWRSLRKKVAGKSRRAKAVLESEWRFYKSSSKRVLDDIACYGLDQFSFEILHVWKTRAEVNEAEVREQFSRDVLRALDASGEYAYYNESILSKFYRPRPAGTPEYEKKCENISKGLKAHRQSTSYVHPLSGKPHPNRGKRLPQTRAKTSVSGRLRWTDGKSNLLLPKDTPPPEGFVRGVTAKKRGATKAEIDYYKNPRRCSVCGEAVAFRKRKSNIFCSRECAIVGKEYPQWKSGTNPQQMYVYHTPVGTFTSSTEAGLLLGCTAPTVASRCRREVPGYSIEKWCKLRSND